MPISEAYLEERDKYFAKGLKLNIMYCDDSLPGEQEELYQMVKKKLCNVFRDRSTHEWLFASVPYLESEDLIETNVEMEEGQYSAEQKEVIGAYIEEKLVMKDPGQTIEELEGVDFISDFEIAAKLALRTYPDSVIRLEENDIPSFIRDALTFNENIVRGGASTAGKQKQYPIVFLSDKKVKTPPGILLALANQLSGLVKVAFGYNPSEELMKSIGLPLSLVNDNVLLMFDSVDGKVATYMYDRNMFGKYSALSVLSFCVNIFQHSEGKSESSEFELWTQKNNNHLRLPFQIRAAEAPDEEAAPESKDTGKEDQGDVEFRIRDLQSQASSEEFRSLCLNEHDEEHSNFVGDTRSICFVGIFDRFSDHISQDIATLEALQKFVYDSDTLLSSSKKLKFKLNFLWIDAVCNRELVHQLGFDPGLTPSLATILRSEKGVLLSERMLKAYSEPNGANFVRDIFRYRSLLWKESGERYGKYIARFQQYNPEAVDALLAFDLRHECEEGGLGEPEDDIDDMLREIQEEEERERQLRQAEMEREREEAEKAAKQSKKGKKKKKKKKKSKEKEEL